VKTEKVLEFSLPMFTSIFLFEAGRKVLKLKRNISLELEESKFENILLMQVN